MTSETASNSKHRGKGKGWSSGEDRAICKAWLDVSQDPIVSVNQKNDTMYARILLKFKDICATDGVAGEDYKSRTAQAIKSRWAKISRAVSKFVGYLSTIEKENQSGASPTDMVQNACVLYTRKENAPFSVMHCYEILHNAPKWKLSLTEQSTSTQGTPSVGSETSTDNPETPSGSSTRPIGQKRAKSEQNHTDNINDTLRVLAEVSEKKLDDSRKRTAVLEQLVHHKIMRVEMDKVSPTAKKFYGLMQEEILREIEAKKQAANNKSTEEEICLENVPSAPNDIRAAQVVDLVEGEQEASCSFSRSGTEMFSSQELSFQIGDTLVQRQTLLERLGMSPDILSDDDLNALNISIERAE